MRFTVYMGKMSCCRFNSRPSLLRTVKIVGTRLMLWGTCCDAMLVSRLPRPLPRPIEQILPVRYLFENSIESLPGFAFFVERRRSS